MDNNDPARLLCSTAICPLPAEPVQVLERWQELCRELQPDGLAPDARLQPGQQAELMRLARRAGIACGDLEHPVVRDTGRQAPDPTSADRDERRAALYELGRTVERASRHGVGRVVLGPGRLPLSRLTVVERFARGGAVEAPLARLAAERAAGAAGALDALCQVLDPALGLSERLGTQLVLPVPAPWPDQLPDAAEVERLCRLFAGAPLAVTVATDWWHVARQLGRAPTRLPHASTLRVSDACGLTAMLPPGTGELDWEELGAARGDASASTVILACGAAIAPTPGELAGVRTVLRLA